MVPAACFMILWRQQYNPLESPVGEYSKLVVFIVTGLCLYVESADVGLSLKVPFMYLYTFKYNNNIVIFILSVIFTGIHRLSMKRPKKRPQVFFFLL